jgi:hypothetical protein
MSTEHDAKAKDIARLAYLIFDIQEVERIDAAETFAILLRLLPDCEALQAIKREVEVLHEIRREHVRAYSAYRKTLPPDDSNPFDF